MKGCCINDKDSRISKNNKQEKQRIKMDATMLSNSKNNNNM